MPRDDDDDDRPRRRSRDEDDYDDDDDFEDHRSRRTKRSGISGWTIGIIIGAVFALGLCIIAVPVMLLLPAVSKVREASTRAQDANNLKQIGIAFHNSADATGLKLYGPFAHDERTGLIFPQNSFRVSLLPYLEQQNLHSQFDLNQAWDSPRNKPFSSTIVKQYHLPGQESTNTPYRIFVGAGPDQPLFNADGKPAKFTDVADGLSNTILAVHATEHVPWAKPQEFTYSANQPLPPMGEPGDPGYNVIMADGSIRYIKRTASEPALRALITRSGGERVGIDDVLD